MSGTPLVNSRLSLGRYEDDIIAREPLCHLVIYLLTCYRVNDARLKDIGVVQNRAVTLGKGQNHWHFIVAGICHDIGHLILVRRAYDEIGFDGCFVKLIDSLKPVVRVKHTEVDICSRLTKTVKSQTHTLVELNITAALEIIGVPVQVHATRAQVSELTIGVERQHEEHIESGTALCDVIVVPTQFDGGT